MEYSIEREIVNEESYITIDKFFSWTIHGYAYKNANWNAE